MLNTHRFQLTVASPLHIGCGTVYTRLEFAHLGRTLYIIHEQKLAQALAQRNLLAPFIHQIEQQGRNFSLASFLQQNRLHNEAFYREIAAYTLPTTFSPPDPSPPELHAFIKTSQGQPYLPGSSIKGAFRVAVLYGLLKRLPEDQQNRLLIQPIQKKLDELRRERDLRKARRERNRLRQKLGSLIRIDFKLLQDFHLQEIKKRGPNTDLLRVWEVQDTPPLSPGDLQVYTVKLDKVAPRGRSQGRQPLAVEALKPGSQTTVTFTFHQALWEDFRRFNPHPPISWDLYEDVLLDPAKTLREMTQDLINEERKRLRDPEFQQALQFSPPPNARLGWGQGLLSTTLFLLLPDDLRQQIRNELFRNEGSAPAPLTRRLANGQLMGFVRLDPL